MNCSLKLIILFFMATSCCYANCYNNSQNKLNLTTAPLATNEMLSVGDVAPNIILKGKGGKKKLNKLSGKLVLVKFWASWCLPCRKANPQWLRLYNTYKNAKFDNAKGFEIFAVSLDVKKRDWKKAIKADQLNYKNNTIDKKGWDSPYAFIYGLKQLPGYFLLDTEGKIIAIDPSPSQLQNILLQRLK